MASARTSLACLAVSGRFAIAASARCAPRRAALAGGARWIQSSAVRREQKANISAKRDPASKVDRSRSKLYKNADEAVKDIQSGSTILSAGFGLCGTAGMFSPNSQRRGNIS